MTQYGNGPDPKVRSSKVGVGKGGGDKEGREVETGPL